MKISRLKTAYEVLVYYLEINDGCIDRESTHMVCTMCDEDQVQLMVDETVKAIGAAHYAVDNAGISSKPRVMTDELEVDSYDRVCNINQRGVWLCKRAELRQMLKQEPELVGRQASRSSLDCRDG